MAVSSGSFPWPLLINSSHKIGNVISNKLRSCHWEIIVFIIKQVWFEVFFHGLWKVCDLFYHGVFMFMFDFFFQSFWYFLLLVRWWLFIFMLGRSFIGAFRFIWIFIITLNNGCVLYFSLFLNWLSFVFNYKFRAIWSYFGHLPRQSHQRVFSYVPFYARIYYWI